MSIKYYSLKSFLMRGCNCRFQGRGGWWSSVKVGEATVETSAPQRLTPPPSLTSPLSSAFPSHRYHDILSHSSIWSEVQRLVYKLQFNHASFHLHRHSDWLAIGGISRKACFVKSNDQNPPPSAHEENAAIVSCTLTPGNAARSAAQLSIISSVNPSKRSKARFHQSWAS